MRTGIVAILIGLVWPAAALAGSPGAAAGKAVLDDGSPWRAQFVWVQTAERIAGWSHRGEPPPEDWAAPEFDDGTWARYRVGLKRNEYFAYGVQEGGALSPALDALYLRGKFTVKDPAAANLSLALSYRGGVVIRVNGRELARSHIPKDADLGARAVAEAYPAETYYRADGKMLCSRGSDLLKNRDRAQKRVRELSGVSIPASALKPGTNVLAVEIHAAPFDAKVARSHNANNWVIWNTCGLVSLELRGGAGAEPNTARPAGLAVWNASALDPVGPESWADPHERLRPVKISGARNGAFCAQVVAGADGPLGALRAEITDLAPTAAGGKPIPASAVAISYPQMEREASSGYLDVLAPAPAADAKVQPVWLKVRVPADAAAGEYRGTLKVAALGASVPVPVELTVADWRLPDPKDYATTLGLIESPESVAMKYNAPLWSDRHFELLDRTYALLGEAGNKFVWLPLICRTNLGNDETIVRWIREGDGYKHDFKALDRYLDLVQKHLKPEIVCLYVWDNMAGGLRKRPGFRGFEEGEGVQVSVLDPASGKVEMSPLLKYSDPAAAGFWKPVLTEIRARLEKRGLLPATMFGIEGDFTHPSEEAKKVLEAAMPGTKWVVQTHPRVERAYAGYNTAVYISMFPPPGHWDAKSPHGWQVAQRTGAFPRYGGPATRCPLKIFSPPALYRIYNEAAQLAGLGGLGRTGADYWQVLKSPNREGNWEKLGYANKKTNSLVARYPIVDWNQLNLDTGTEEVLAAGPDGALGTVRFENLREGVQECEARIFIEKAILSGKLDAALTRKCKDVLDERQLCLRTTCFANDCIDGSDGGFLWYAASGSEGLAGKLFAAAAEAAEAAARTGGR